MARKRRNPVSTPVAVGSALAGGVALLVGLTAFQRWQANKRPMVKMYDAKGNLIGTRPAMPGDQ